MLKKGAALFCTVTLLFTAFAFPASAAFIATNIPKTFPIIKQDASSTVVNFWHANTSRNSVLCDNLANWYNATLGKKNKIYVKPIFQGAYADITLKLNAALQSSNLKALPDLVQLAADGAFTVKEAKSIVYMADLMKTDPTFKMSDKLNKNLVWSCSYKGKQLGMPFSCSLIALHYNATAFKAVGLDPDKPPKTFEELGSYASKLVIKGTGKRPSRYGLSHKIASYTLSTLIPRQSKGTAYQFDNEDGRLGTPTKYLAGTNGSLKATMTAWKNVCSTGAVNPQGTTTEYKVGASAMAMSSMIDYTSVRDYLAGLKDKNKVFEPKMSRLPCVNADDSVDEGAGGSAVYMFDKGDKAKKSATWDFVKFLASTDVSAYWYVNSGYYPVSNDAYNTKYVADYLDKDENIKYMATALIDSAANYKFQSPFIPSQNAYTTIVQNVSVQIAENKKSVDEGCTMIVKKAESILAEYRKANAK